MRIAYMLSSLGIGGAEKQAISIAERMAARGHEVLLIVLRDAERHEWPTRLRIVHLGMKRSPRGVVGGLLHARRSLRFFKPDLLHSHTFPANMVARILGAMGLAPLVLSTIHNIYEGGAHRDFAYRITGWLSAHITAVSEAIAERCVRTKAVAPSRYSVLKNGIDTKSFSPSRFPGRVETEHVEHQFVWLAAGRDVPAKDFDSLLAAFQIVRAAIPDAQLQIAGKPASHRGISLNEAGVCWMGLSTDMPRTIFHCDAFVLSSAWEGMPLVIGEAMAMEKPVVATDVGGVREMVGQAGVLIRPKDPQALAEAMLRIMRMREPERRAMGSAARERILQYFDMDMKADEWESLYARLFRNERDSAFIRADLGACE